MGGLVFKKCYEDILPEILDENTKLLKMTELEADDLIYLSSEQILKNNPKSNITIISSDHDLLQIIDGRENVNLYTANLKLYNDKSLGTNDLDCFSKAIMGDPSDNIPKVFKRLGKKTMLKLYNSPKLLEKKFRENEGSFKQYCLNRTLVDFKNIPIKYLKKFRDIGEL